jgi:RND superfamily putative drug exporter
MSLSLLYFKLAQAVLKRPKTVILIWLAILVAGAAITLTVMKPLSNTFNIPNTESQAALEQLEHTFPQVAGTTANIVIEAAPGDKVTDSEYRSQIDQLVEYLKEQPWAETVLDPFEDLTNYNISSDEMVAVVSMNLSFQMFNDSPLEPLATEGIHDLAAQLSQTLPAGAQAVEGGNLYSISFPELTIFELFGVVIAFLVLFAMFGTFLASIIPIVSSLVALVLSMVILFSSTAVESVNSVTPLLALMLGLAVGIDYALFIMSKHVQLLKRDLVMEKSIAYSVSTAGGAVTFAGATVMIALLGLSLAFIPFLSIMGVFTAIGVAFSIVSSITFLPAVLGLLGSRVLSKRYRTEYLTKAANGELLEYDMDRPEEDSSAQSTKVNRFYDGWFKLALKVPLLTIVLIVGLLGVLTIPIKDLRLSIPDALSLAKSEPARAAADITVAHFADYDLNPIVVTAVILQSDDPLGLMDDLKKEFAKVPGVGLVPIATPNMDATQGIVQILPRSVTDAPETEQLVHTLRSMHDDILQRYNFDLKVTGYTAVKIDISAKLGEAILPFGIVVVTLAFLLLLMIFRSLYLPFAATIGFLLSLGAALGTLALFYNIEVLADFIGVIRMGSVISFAPLIVMSILFGLAMDYQVFSGSMYIEEYSKSGDEHQALHRSFMNSAKVIVAAFVVMFAIFLMFVPGEYPNLKPIAFALAVGVLADAVLVRMMLMPAVDALVGKRAFLLPKFIDRYLPHIDIEGKTVAALEQARLETADRSALVIVNQVLGQSFDIGPNSNLLIEYHHSDRGRRILLAIAGRLQLNTGYVKIGADIYPFAKDAVLKKVAYVDLAKTKLNAENVVGKHTVLAVVDGLNFLEDQTDVENFLQAWSDFRALYPDISLIFGSSSIFDPVLTQIFESRLVLRWEPEISAQFDTPASTPPSHSSPGHSSSGNPSPGHPSPGHPSSGQSRGKLVSQSVSKEQHHGV